MEENRSFRSGFIAIIGKPNVGKSTILNSLVGSKISITSPKPQTTRDRIVGVRHVPNGQLIFIDTPGLCKPSLLMERKMVNLAKESLLSTDLILTVTEPFGFEKEDRYVFALLPPSQDGKKTPVFLLINKIDRVDKRRLLPLIQEGMSLYPFQEILPLSALKGDNMDVLLQKSIDAMPSGPSYYPKELLTDREERFMIKESIREKIFHLTHQEIPYGVAVQVEEVTEREDGLLVIRATLFVERESQKAIVIGRGGRQLKAIGERARKELENYFKKKIFLDLWVKVYKDWRQNEQALRQLGYAE